MSEENIHVDTLVTEDMSKDELYDYAKYLEYRKEELLNINSSLQQKVEQLENIRKEAIKIIKKQMPICIMPNNTLIHGTEKAKVLENLLNILNKGSDK